MYRRPLLMQWRRQTGHLLVCELSKKTSKPIQEAVRLPGQGRPTATASGLSPCPKRFFDDGPTPTPEGGLLPGVPVDGSENDT